MFPINTKIKTLVPFSKVRVIRGQEGFVRLRYANGDYAVEFERKGLGPCMEIASPEELEEVVEIEYFI